MDEQTKAHLEAMETRLLRHTDAVAEDLNPRPLF